MTADENKAHNIPHGVWIDFKIKNIIMLGQGGNERFDREAYTGLKVLKIHTLITRRGKQDGAFSRRKRGVQMARNLIVFDDLFQ